MLALGMDRRIWLYSHSQGSQSSSSPMPLLVWVRQGGAGSVERGKQEEKQKWYMIHIPGRPMWASM